MRGVQRAEGVNDTHTTRAGVEVRRHHEDHLDAVHRAAAHHPAQGAVPGDPVPECGGGRGCVHGPNPNPNPNPTLTLTLSLALALTQARVRVGIV